MEQGYVRLDAKMLLTERAGERLRKLGRRSGVPAKLDPTQQLKHTDITGVDTGAEIVPLRPNRVGETVGRCMLTRLIGVGGGGAVYEALHVGMGISVAVKMLAEKGVRAEVRQALRDEARLLAQLNHPNIVRIYDFSNEGPEPYIVMELVAGSSLADLIAQSGDINPGRAAGLLVQAVRGLEAAADMGVVHRDVKPANLLVTKRGQVKLADLGLAWFRNQTTGSTGGLEFGGTVAYMAPERFGDSAIPDIRADLYSLGVTLYEALTGRLPYEGGTPFELMVQHAEDPIPDPRTINPLIPAELVQIYARLMAKRPAGRYASYGELLEHFEHFFRTLPGQEEIAAWNPFLTAKTYASNSAATSWPASTRA